MSHQLIWQVRSICGDVAEEHELPADRCEILPSSPEFPDGAVRVRNWWLGQPVRGGYMDIDRREIVTAGA